ncbi:MAG: TonB-dependent receptor plug domain-containing protein, partial [Bacteroidota bacterium]
MKYSYTHTLQKAYWLAIFCLLSHWSWAKQFASANEGVYRSSNKEVYAKQPASRALTEVLREMETEFSISFIYSPDLITGKTVSKQLQAKNLTKKLQEVLSQLGLSFKKLDKTHYVIIQKGNIALPESKVEKGALDALVIENQSASLNTKSVQWEINEQVVVGKVTTAEGEAIPGASVLLKGTTNGTATDANGNYKLSLPDGGGILVFSFIGFVSQEIALNNQTTINITLVSDVKALSEVVVVGYGTQQRKDLTGSISSVTAAQIEKVPVTTIDKALQGRSAGVQVTTDDGSPGASISVRIRGIGSIGDNSPLYVVDGYPISGGINTLNPNDIATIDVLKDASATAIYGSRA